MNYPDEMPFHRAICCQPNDLAPRLIFADWLEEQGHTARATRIRSDIATGRVEVLERYSWQEDPSSKAKYIIWLEDEKSPKTQSTQSPITSTRLDGLSIRRNGFVECLCLPRETWEELHDRFLVSHPINQIIFAEEVRDLIRWKNRYPQIHFSCFEWKYGFIEYTASPFPIADLLEKAKPLAKRLYTIQTMSDFTRAQIDYREWIDLD